MSPRFFVIFLLFFTTACDQGFCSHSWCGSPEEVTIVDAGVKEESTSYTDISSELDETDIVEPRFCNWTDPVQPELGFVHLNLRWNGDEITERDFYTDKVLSVEEFDFSPYIMPQTYIIGVWCANWVQTGGQDFWTDYREIPYLGQKFATFSVDISKEAVQQYDYCFAFIHIICVSRGGGGCWRGVEKRSGNENYPIIHINGSMEYCVNNGEVIEADINDNHFYSQDPEAYSEAFYLNEL